MVHSLSQHTVAEKPIAHTHTHMSRGTVGNKGRVRPPAASAAGSHRFPHHPGRTRGQATQQPLPELSSDEPRAASSVRRARSVHRRPRKQKKRRCRQRAWRRPVRASVPPSVRAGRTRWQLAFKLLEAMPTAGVAADVVSFAPPIAPVARVRSGSAPACSSRQCQPRS